MRVQVRLIDSFLKAGWFRRRELGSGTVLYAENPGKAPLGGMVTCYTENGKRLRVPRSLLEIVPTPEERAAEEARRMRKEAAQEAAAMRREQSAAREHAQRRKWAYEDGHFAVMLTGLRESYHAFGVQEYLRDLPGLRDGRPQDVADLVERVLHVAPQPVAEGVAQRDAIRLKTELEEKGAKVRIIEGRRVRQSERGREAIPSSVRREVWTRDGGRCVDCGSRERLEYDHIIPLSKGGANTARNIELRCEVCNRKKGASI